ncbi:hypothetical protein LO763_01480 [Glycomyces sp. A-F 0318]|uniref:hypothetical protein n=1 Tax=Glycomyces amatae TaxID=2881355 RepID=UPI001E368FE2|nr:hypothetical protein [Glycomyces amatae]MCD0442296.1 hypothetical protein [Glycomyces amatae]
MNRNAVGETTRRTTLSDDFDGARFAAVIDGRRLYFEAFPAQSRFRVTVADARTGRSAALGSVIRLDTDAPGLRICAPLEVEWATRNAEEIVAEAVDVWDSITRREG